MSVVSHARDIAGQPPLRHDWSRSEVEALFALPLTELLFRAAQVHREHVDPAEVQVSTLLSVKTGGCPEDCAYCPQAQRYHTGVDATKLMATEAVLEKARRAAAGGAGRRRIAGRRPATGPRSARRPGRPTAAPPRRPGTARGRRRRVPRTPGNAPRTVG